MLEGKDYLAAIVAALLILGPLSTPILFNRTVQTPPATVGPS
jgi:hypothetical protein